MAAADGTMAVAATTEAEESGAVVRAPATMGGLIVAPPVAAIQPIILIPRFNLPIVNIPLPMV